MTVHVHTPAAEMQILQHQSVFMCSGCDGSMFRLSILLTAVLSVVSLFWGSICISLLDITQPNAGGWYKKHCKHCVNGEKDFKYTCRLTVYILYKLLLDLWNRPIVLSHNYSHFVCFTPAVLPGKFGMSRRTWVVFLSKLTQRYGNKYKMSLYPWTMLCWAAAFFHLQQPLTFFNRISVVV